MMLGNGAESDEIEETEKIEDAEEATQTLLEEAVQGEDLQE